MELQTDLYRKRFGYLPSRIYADKIYMNRENRKLMKELEIEAMGKPLGRPPKDPNLEYEKRMAKAAGERNEVRFWNGKTDISRKQCQGEVAGNGKLPDVHVLFRQECDEVLKSEWYRFIDRGDLVIEDVVKLQRVGDKNLKAANNTIIELQQEIMPISAVKILMKKYSVITQ